MIGFFIVPLLSIQEVGKANNIMFGLRKMIHFLHLPVGHWSAPLFLTGIMGIKIIL